VKDRKKIEVYYSLFKLVKENPRAKGKEIALTLGRSGRGSTISSATKQLKNMYDAAVSFKPHLILKTFTDYERKAFFCKKSGKYGIANIFYKLYRKYISLEISSAMLLAGNRDFFVITRNEDMNMNSLGLNVCESSTFYDPIYTIPHGWKNPMKKCIRDFLKGDFTKDRLNRKTYGELHWNEIDWKIYRAIRKDLRKPFKQIGKKIGIFSNKVKELLYDEIIPCCTIANYFFPRGYQHYDTAFMKLETEFEKSIIKKLKKLPCTTYVFPLEDSIVLIIFHEGIKDMLFLTKKIEEIGLSDDLLLSVPLASTF
jgi:DNA-binding Lrp family transcriptional regulator